MEKIEYFQLKELQLFQLSTIEDNGEDALEGATADDADADFINAALENEIFSPNGFLGHYV